MAGPLNAADQKNQFEADISGDVKQAAASAIADMKDQLRKDPQKVATRVASQKTIETLFAHIPSLFGGSADLTGSNNTKVVGHEIFQLLIRLVVMCIMECVNMAWPRL